MSSCSGGVMKYTFAVVWGLLVTAAAFSQDRPKLNKGQVDQYEVACGTDALSCWTLGEDYLYSKHDGQTASVFLGMAKEKGYRNSVKYDQVGDEYLRLNDWKTLDPGGTAYHWYQDAADLGDPAAQTHLADFYSKPGPYYNPPYVVQDRCG
jgi:TPR repeat protein